MNIIANLHAPNKGQLPAHAGNAFVRYRLDQSGDVGDRYAGVIDLPGGEALAYCPACTMPSAIREGFARRTLRVRFGDRGPSVECGRGCRGGDVYDAIGTRQDALDFWEARDEWSASAGGRHLYLASDPSRPARVADLARRLGLPVGALEAFGVVPDGDRWLAPSLAWDGYVNGLLRELLVDGPAAIDNGLGVAAPLAWGDLSNDTRHAPGGPVYVVTNLIDAVAMHAAGLCVIVRPARIAPGDADAEAHSVGGVDPADVDDVADLIGQHTACGEPILALEAEPVIVLADHPTAEAFAELLTDRLDDDAMRPYRLVSGRRDGTCRVFEIASPVGPDGGKGTYPLRRSYVAAPPPAGRAQR